MKFKIYTFQEFHLWLYMQQLQLYSFTFFCSLFFIFSLSNI